MKITITFREALDKGVWIKLCSLKGLNEWCMKEGQADGSEEAELTMDEAEELGLLKEQ